MACYHAEGVDLSTLMEDTKYLQLLAKVYQKAGRPENALEALTRAREKQSKYSKILSGLAKKD